VRGTHRRAARPVSRILVTGANGHLGRRLLATIDQPTRAVVRSTRAAATLAEHPDVGIVDYGDADAMTEVCAGCSKVVHLVGIVKEGAGASYESAHVETTRALLRAATATGVERIVYLSVLGAGKSSPNRCLATKAVAESLLLDSPIGSLVLRVPMVLGEGDFASRALLARASRRLAFSFRAGSREQPIYAGDVIAAIVQGIADDGPCGVVELAGPRSLPRRELIALASTMGTRTISLPVVAGHALAALLERVSANPPVTRAMLDVLDHDDAIDPMPAAEALGIELTSLEETVARIRG